MAILPQHYGPGHTRRILDTLLEKSLGRDFIRQDGFVLGSSEISPLFIHPFDPGTYGGVIGMAIEKSDLLRQPLGIRPVVTVQECEILPASESDARVARSRN